MTTIFRPDTSPVMPTADAWPLPANMRGLVAPAFTPDERKAGLPPFNSLAASAFDLAPKSVRAELDAVLSVSAKWVALMRDLVAVQIEIDRDPNLSPAGKQGRLQPLVTQALSRAAELPARLDGPRNVADATRRRIMRPIVVDAVQGLRDHATREAFRGYSPAERLAELQALTNDPSAEALEAVRAILGAPLVWRRQHVPELADPKSGLQSACFARCFPEDHASVAWLQWAIEVAERIHSDGMQWLRNFASSVGVPPTA